MLNNFEVLDTFKFKEGKIFLKKYHFERSLEACQMINPQVSQNELEKIYEEIEERYSKVIRKNQILRLLLTTDVDPVPKTEIILKSEFPSIPTLQLITEIKQTEGIGKQNYKWTDREFWTNAMRLRSKEADDVICENANEELTETSRFNLFFYDKKSDQVFTPRLDSGCINGVYRRYVMYTGSIMLPDIGLKQISEKLILSSELNDYTIYIANSVREVLKARLLTRTR